MCSVADTALVKAKDPLWAATRTGFIKPEQALASSYVGASLCTSEGLQEHQNFFLLTTVWNGQVSSTSYFWKTDLYHSVIGSLSDTEPLVS